MISPEERLEQMRRLRDAANRKAAQANRENERLRHEVRELRLKNFTLQRFIDDPSSQSGYKVRYEHAVEAMHRAADLLKPVLNGLPHEAPHTLEPPRPPLWARVKFEGGKK